MALLILKRLGNMALIMLVVSVILFLLLEVNGERVTSAAELKLRLESMPDPIMILLSRKGRYLTKKVSLR